MSTATVIFLVSRSGRDSTERQLHTVEKSLGCPGRDQPARAALLDPLRQDITEGPGTPRVRDPH